MVGCLDVGWEEHLIHQLPVPTLVLFLEEEETYDSARSAESLCGEVGGELGLDSARLSVWSGDSALMSSVLINSARYVYG